jgi:hypothetical protein
MIKADDWLVESLRLTAFTSDPLSAKGLEWWSALTGSDPESISSRAGLGVHTATGTFSDMNLTLNLAPGRVDWFFYGTPSEDSLAPTIGSFSKATVRFDEVLPLWLDKNVVSIQRLALGVIARMPVDDKVSGYRRMAALLPSVNIDPTNSSELIYQINRPRVSNGTNKLTINRLSKWSVVLLATTQISGHGTNAAMPVATFGRVELDMNTDPQFKGALGNNSALILRELEVLAGEILENGDLP